MSAEHDKSGRAFPWCGDLNDCPTMDLGMTRRDYFAGNALQGLISGTLAQGITPREDDEKMMAKVARAFAEAMVRELDR